jgi:hypothetical protein
MVRRAPHPRRKYTAPSSPSAGPVTEVCEKFLRLPALVVLAVLWLFGALLLGLVLGTVLEAAYWTELWLSEAMAQL